VTEQTSVWRQFPRSFWIANVMEISERMGWYGFYAVSTLYLNNAVADGGLGFTSEDRGVIQGLATFFLYLWPAFFGALAERYGYRRMFLASAVVMAPAYILLIAPRTFWGFLGVYFLVAVGHGMFKPVVISTIAKTTDEKTGSMGFGIFYMMVTIVAGVVRGWDWKYVFWASAGWIVVMGVTCLLLYREPPRDVETESRRSLWEVLVGMVKVVGNGRFFLLVVGLMFMLVMGSKWWSFPKAATVAGAWLAVNFLWDVVLRARRRDASGPWALQPMRVGEGRYLVFLLLMAGFWTSFNQIFMTLPEYIRDYVDTGDLIGIVESFMGWFGADASAWSRALLENGQIKPEYLINLNAGAIIFFQVLISWMVRRTSPLTSIISGVAVTVASFTIYLINRSGWVIVAAIVVFSIGEMLASPRSKEYAGRIAPPDKVGVYMGYFYWCVALGNLFGGLLSGVSYQYFGPHGIDRPDAMWVLFAVLAATTAVGLVLYNRIAVPSRQSS
jgi:dipeptide/tripeptide permease